MCQIWFKNFELKFVRMEQYHWILYGILNSSMHYISKIFFKNFIHKEKILTSFAIDAYLKHDNVFLCFHFFVLNHVVAKLI